MLCGFCDAARPTWHWRSSQRLCCVVATGTTGEAVAFCALSAEPDPSCKEPNVTNCAGNALLECKAGYATSTRACAAECLVLDDYPDRCVGETELDPARCTTDGYLCTMASGSTYDEVAVSSIEPTTSAGCAESTLPKTGRS